MKKNLYPFSCVHKKLALFILGSMFVLGTTINAQSYTFFDPVTEFPSGGPGGSEANNDDNPPQGGVETGLKLRFTRAGSISAVRFYKGNNNTGLHVGRIWNMTTGTILTSANFTGETANGWQQLTFGSPVFVDVNDVYLASVFSPTGTYNATIGYFSSSISNNTMIAVGAGDSYPGVSNGNGVYEYTAAPRTTGNPPTSTFNGTNYWIDIVFTPLFALPVGLSDLRAATSEKNVTVSWNTSFESNNKGFEIQRSNNNTDWYSVSFVNGAGESTGTRSYNYTDRDLAPGLYYYRLKQVDFDGQSKNSATITATVSGKGKVSLYANFPNPVRKVTSVRFDLPTAQKVRLSVVDMNGRVVKLLVDKQGEAGSHLVNIDASGLSRQVYIIRLQTADGDFTQKMLVE
ncbi:MAG: DUF4082 domain-containing protein [Chitinophagaceae bacterium]|nr:DUF4082 domain-containing protein [Chitinophagaceae bacterium]